MHCLASRNTHAFYPSQYSALSLSVLEHQIVDAPVRIPSSDIVGCHWCTGENGWDGSDQLSLDHRNNPTVITYHAVRQWTIENSGHIHSAENSGGRLRFELYLSNVRSLLTCGDGSRANGSATSERALLVTWPSLDDMISSNEKRVVAC